jgi:hypothetical protein
MKRSIVFMASLYLAATGLALAQNKMSTPPTPKLTPVLRGPAQDPNAHSFNILLRLQMRRIPKDLKAGKITKAQAQAAWENLRAMRKQELEFFKQNGQKEITADQKNQLTETLQKNAI